MIQFITLNVPLIAYRLYVGVSIPLFVTKEALYYRPLLIRKLPQIRHSVLSLFLFPRHDLPSFFPALVPGPQFFVTSTNRATLVRFELTLARKVKSTSTLT